MNCILPNANTLFDGCFDWILDNAPLTQSDLFLADLVLQGSEKPSIPLTKEVDIREWNVHDAHQSSLCDLAIRILVDLSKMLLSVLWT